MGTELVVKDILTQEYIGVSESDTVQDAVSLMREEWISCVLVIRGSEPVGIMTEWDVLGLVAENGDPTTTEIQEVMTSPVLTINATIPVREAATMMTNQHIRNLVVVEADETIGVLTERDLIAAAGSFTGTIPDAEPDESMVTNATVGTEESEFTPNGGDEFSTQGVCESCGSLAESLNEVNGKLVCTDCRSI